MSKERIAELVKELRMFHHYEAARELERLHNVVVDYGRALDEWNYKTSRE